MYENGLYTFASHFLRSGQGRFSVYYNLRNITAYRELITQSTKCIYSSRIPGYMGGATAGSLVLLIPGVECISLGHPLIEITQ